MMSTIVVTGADLETQVETWLYVNKKFAKKNWNNKFLLSCNKSVDRLMKKEIRRIE